ncbi:MAG: sulfurtransferase [Nitrososphaera sp.]|nr:sulfurtransferase [Candidatus Nitrosocaldus islandicus]
MVMLVTVDELKKMLDAKAQDLLIVDARSWHEYCYGHIPGAVNMDLFAFHWADTSDEGIERFNSSLKMLLKSAGITYDKHIIFYDDITGTLAARGLWLMHYICHEHTMVLDGGFSMWRRRGYPVEKEPTRPSPVNEEYTYRFNNDVLATYRYILERMNNHNVRIVDARSREEYYGIHVRASRGGHIPNAVNIDWEANMMHNGTMKPVEMLRSVYSSILHRDDEGNDDKEGVKEDDDNDMEIICYCQGGYRAAHAYLALKLLGMKKVRVYLGSWYEWGNRYELPVE